MGLQEDQSKNQIRQLTVDFREIDQSLNRLKVVILRLKRWPQHQLVLYKYYFRPLCSHHPIL